MNVGLRNALDVKGHRRANGIASSRAPCRLACSWKTRRYNSVQNCPPWKTLLVNLTSRGNVDTERRYFGGFTVLATSSFSFCLPSLLNAPGRKTDSVCASVCVRVEITWMKQVGLAAGTKHFFVTMVTVFWCLLLLNMNNIIAHVDNNNDDDNVTCCCLRNVFAL